MELTIESALSVGAWVGHLSYFLLVLSMLMRRIHTLRVFAVLSAVVGITYAAVWLSDPVSVFWESALLLVNVGQLALMRWEDRVATFSEEEAAFVADVLPALPRAAARRLLDLGWWVHGEEGAVLTREGQSVPHLLYLATGEAAISTAGVEVGVCGPGAFIGEVTVLHAAPATATATLTRPSRYWAVDARVLRQAAEADPTLRRSLQASFARTVREKLVRSNARMARERRDGSGPART